VSSHLQTWHFPHQRKTLSAFDRDAENELHGIQSNSVCSPGTKSGGYPSGDSTHRKQSSSESPPAYSAEPNSESRLSFPLPVSFVPFHTFISTPKKK
jgi:hypothetical protein